MKTLNYTPSQLHTIAHRATSPLLISGILPVLFTIVRPTSTASNQTESTKATYTFQQNRVSDAC